MESEADVLTQAVKEMLYMRSLSSLSFPTYMKAGGETAVDVKKKTSLGQQDDAKSLSSQVEDASRKKSIARKTRKSGSGCRAAKQRYKDMLIGRWRREYKIEGGGNPQGNPMRT